ncbi:MAG TPA: PGPGW domain-containing protein [Egibacteraceae bacterium]|nr:PGPGW domain-containing protein [Egibacteraceae bacterium]
MKDDTKEVIRRRVDRVQRAYRHHGVIYRVLWVAVGATITLAGLAMTVLPGPAIIVLPVGMAMLAAEFTLARRLLEVGIERGVDAKRRMQAAPPAAKWLSALTGLCLAGAVGAYLLLR